MSEKQLKYAGYAILYSTISLLIFIFFFDAKQPEIKPRTFTNARGKPITDSALHLLVISQYTVITKDEQDTLNTYFQKP